ncbi:MAG: class I SAM-dependent methyltransferase [Patescibacteria group bacterium]
MWKKYFKKHEKRKPRKNLVRAVAFCVNKKTALDLGSGTMIESKFLARKGFNVTAVDNSPDARKYAKNIKKVHFKNISFQKYNFPKKTFDLINSQFSLHLYGKEGFNTFIKKIKNSLKPKGIFVAQFLGVKDSWNGDLKTATPRANYVFHTRKQAINLLSGLKILEFKEKDEDGKTVLGGLKHWHIFYFIARKI